MSRWVERPNKNPDPAQMWLTFLRNHRQAIAAMDFFTVPTLTFGVLYCFFVHRPRSAKDSALQCDPSAKHLMDCAAAAEASKSTAAPVLVFDRDAEVLG